MDASIRGIKYGQLFLLVIILASLNGLEFAAEMQAFLLAFQMGDDIKSPKVLFEGDALVVILSLKGNKDQEDWKSSSLVELGPSFFG